MRKLYILLFLSIFSFSFSQIHYGVKAGYNLSNMTFDWGQYGKEKLDSKSYFYVGAFLEYQFSDKFSIQEELAYTELGGTMSYEVTDFVGNEVVIAGINTVKFKYPQLQNSVAAKYYPIRKLAFLGGINLGINLNPNLEQSFRSPFTPSGKLENVKSINVFPFLGTEFHITEKLFADARYHFNFFNVKQEGLQNKIGFFQIGLGYRFK